MPFENSLAALCFLHQQFHFCKNPNKTKLFLGIKLTADKISRHILGLFFFFPPLFSRVEVCGEFVKLEKQTVFRMLKKPISL